MLQNLHFVSFEGKYNFSSLIALIKYYKLFVIALRIIICRAFSFCISGLAVGRVAHKVNKKSSVLNLVLAVRCRCDFSFGCGRVLLTRFLLFCAFLYGLPREKREEEQLLTASLCNCVVVVVSFVHIV